MANSSAVEILEDGARNTVLKFSGTLDTSNLASTVVVNIVDQYRDPIGATIGQYRLDDIDYNVADGIALVLSWGGATTRIASFSGRGRMHLGQVYGGMQDEESVNVRDGRILARTVGYTSGVVSFSVVLWLVKQAFEPALDAGEFILMEDGSFILMEDGASKILLE